MNVQYIYGRNTVLSALKQKKVKQIFLNNDFKFNPILEEIKKQQVEVKNVSTKELNELVDGAHQGVVAQIVTYNYSSLEEIMIRAKKKEHPLILILDEINDPHNLGAILRSCDAFGVDGIIMKKNNQVPLNATVAKVSTGAIDYVPVAQVTNLNTAIETMKKNGYWIVATDGSAKQEYHQVDYKMPIGLVIGSEGKGISRLVLKNSDFIIKINMFGHVNSLNASVACAIVLAQISHNRSL